MSPPLFSAEFEEQLGYGKYTKWVLFREFSEDHLLCLLCMAGELDSGASDVFQLLGRHWPELAPGADRSAFALAALLWIVRGERFHRHEWSRRLLEGRIRREPRDLPEPVQAAVGATTPGAAWDRVMMIAEGYELVGKDAAGKDTYAYLSPEGGVLHIGPERRLEPAAQRSVFPATLLAALGRDSRSRWAAERAVTADHLQSVLWLVGEFEARHHGIMGLIEQHRSELGDSRRVIAVLHAMCRMASSFASAAERFDVDELDRRIARGRAQLEIGDLPGPARAVLDQASPGTRWKLVLMTPEGYEIGGEEPTGRYIEADVSRQGKVVFKRNIPFDAVPAPVAAAVRARYPGFRMTWAYGLLSESGAFTAYEVLHIPSIGADRKARRIVMSPDGRKISESGA